MPRDRAPHEARDTSQHLSSKSLDLAARPPSDRRREPAPRPSGEGAKRRTGDSSHLQPVAGELHIPDDRRMRAARRHAPASSSEIRDEFPPSRAAPPTTCAALENQRLRTPCAPDRTRPPARCARRRRSRLRARRPRSVSSSRGAAQNFERRQPPGCAHDAAARMRRRAAHEKVPDRRAVPRPSGHRPQKEKLFERKLALKNIPFGQARSGARYPAA